MTQELDWSLGKAPTFRCTPRVSRGIDAERMQKGFERLPQVLAQFGFHSLREAQVAPVTSIMAGMDTICFMPTSGGKSATFALPLLATNKKTVVFEPLVALMQDQVRSFTEKGVRVAQLSGQQTASLNDAVMTRWAQGEVDMLYVAPERLNNNRFKEVMKVQPPEAVVVDEAHCMSSWGHNFRPEYCHIGAFIEKHNPSTVVALTATANPAVAKDIIALLGLQNAKKIASYYRRENLNLTSGPFHTESHVAKLINNTPTGSIIIYLTSIARVLDWTKKLKDHVRDDIFVGMYHGELNPAAKDMFMNQFIEGTARVMCATSAFGMGIDKPDVRLVVHPDIPGTLDDYVQGAGRAGRDGLRSDCMFLYNSASVCTQEFFLRGAHPSRSDVGKVLSVFSRYRDKEGICRLTVEDVLKQANIQFKQTADAVIATLVSSHVIERAYADDKVEQIAVVDSAYPDPKFQAYMEVVQRFGVKNAQGYLNIKRATLTSRMDVGWPTVGKYLKKWSDNGLIHRIPPYTGALTRVIGTLDLVDFDAMARRKEEAYANLETVLQYARVPDEGKQEFIENHFRADARSV